MSGDARFTIRRLGWHQAPHGDHYTRRLPTASPVEHFDNFDEAEYRRRALEHALRAGENPFRFGGASLFFQTSLDGPRLHDWLLDAGIDPPAEQLRHRDWREWWDAFAHTWSEEQLAHAWQGLDKVRFFDVAGEAGTEPFRVVIELRYANGNAYALDADREGGAQAGVYRDARAAAAACDRLNEDRRQGLLFHGRYRVRLGTRAGYGDELSRTRVVAEGVYYETADVPGDVPRFAGAGFLVQRRAFDTGGRVCHDRDGRDTGSRVPVRLFAERSAAGSHRDELIAAAREVMNPFQVFTPRMAGLSEEALVAAVDELRPPLPWPVNFRPELWREWWDLCQDEITPGQRAAAWHLFDAHPLFEVLPVDVHE